MGGAGARGECLPGAARGDLMAGGGARGRGRGRQVPGERSPAAPSPGASFGPRETRLPCKFHLRAPEPEWAGLRQTSRFYMSAFVLRNFVSTGQGEGEVKEGFGEPGDRCVFAKFAE